MNLRVRRVIGAELSAYSKSKPTMNAKRVPNCSDMKDGLTMCLDNDFVSDFKLLSANTRLTLILKSSRPKFTFLVAEITAQYHRRIPHKPSRDSGRRTCCLALNVNN